MGGASGLLLAPWGAKALVSLSPPELGDFRSVEISAAALSFTFVVSLLTGVIFGLVPAFEASNIKLNDTLKEAGRSSTGSARSRRLRGALVVAEIALALTLLAGAGLLARGFLRLQGVDTGFNLLPAGAAGDESGSTDCVKERVEQPNERELRGRLRTF
jgi:putative ABC transport system permease protein